MEESEQLAIEKLKYKEKYEEKTKEQFKIRYLLFFLLPCQTKKQEPEFD